MTKPTHIWVLNPGAERELSPSAAPTQRTVQQMKQREHLFDGLCAGEARVWLDELRTPDASLAGVIAPRGDDALPGRALLWCPVPGAVRLCQARGLTPQPAPSLSVLRQVASKAFLGAALPRWTPPVHRQVWSLDDVRAAHAEAGTALRAKRLDGYAGKGQRTLPVVPAPGDEVWIGANLRGGGLIVEVELTRLGEFSIHGVVTEHGLLVGQPCRTQTDPARAPLSVPTACPDAPRAADIVRAGHEAARALQAIGYRGPFGLDLILSADGLYATDLNARFTLGFSAGLGALRARALEWVLDP